MIKTEPQRGQQKGGGREGHTRRNSHPSPPTLFHRFSSDKSMDTRIKRGGRLDHRQFIEESRHGAEFLHAQLAWRTRRQMLFDIQPLAFLQAAIDVTQNPAFHSFATHNSLLSLPLVLYLLRYKWG